MAEVDVFSVPVRILASTRTTGKTVQTSRDRERGNGESPV